MACVARDSRGPLVGLAQRAQRELTRISWAARRAQSARVMQSLVLLARKRLTVSRRPSPLNRVESARQDTPEPSEGLAMPARQEHSRTPQEVQHAQNAQRRAHHQRRASFRSLVPCHQMKRGAACRATRDQSADPVGHVRRAATRMLWAVQHVRSAQKTCSRRLPACLKRPASGPAQWPSL